MKSAVIILPVHKLFHNLTKNEIHSLEQLNHVLRDFPVCIIAPNDFPVNHYIRFFKHQNILVERFKEESFKAIRSWVINIWKQLLKFCKEYKINFTFCNHEIF